MEEDILSDVVPSNIVSRQVSMFSGVFLAYSKAIYHCRKAKGLRASLLMMSLPRKTSLMNYRVMTTSLSALYVCCPLIVFDFD